MVGKGRQRWLITGASKGLGRALAQSLLDMGASVAGTVRTPADADALRALAPERSHPVLLDVTDSAAIAPAVNEAVALLGGLDVLVNNAGQGLVGAVEEMSDAEIRTTFEVNFFGTLGMIRHSLPHLRENGGQIVNISSAGGLMGFAGIGSYCASKFALWGLSQALTAELAPFGIGIMLVAPGAFRTEFSSASTLAPKSPLAAYDSTPAGRARDMPARMQGAELGDPDKAAEAIIAALAETSPPEMLILGSDAYTTARAALSRFRRQVEQAAQIAASTDFPEAAAISFHTPRGT